MENQLDNVINDILSEVEEKLSEPKDVVKTEKKAEFSTELGEQLYKIANLCREISNQDTSVSYDDMTVFLEKLYAKDSN